MKSGSFDYHEWVQGFCNVVWTSNSQWHVKCSCITHCCHLVQLSARNCRSLNADGYWVWRNRVLLRMAGPEEPSERRMETITLLGASWFVLLTKYEKSHYITENSMGVACGMHGKMRNRFRHLVGKYDVKGHLEDLEIDGRIILKCILRKEGGFVWPR